MSTGNSAKLQETLISMMIYEKDSISFYAHMLSQFKIIQKDDFKHPAGVNFKNGNYHLYINPTLFEEYPLQERVAILVHECQHVLNRHIIRRGQRDHKRWNYGCDIAINQYIKNIPSNGLSHEKYDMPEKLMAEAYYNLLEDEFGDDGEPSSGGENGELIDEHDLWEESEIITEELFNQRTTDIISNAVSKSRGNSPSNIKEILERFSNDIQVPWQQLLRRILGNRKTISVPTHKRLNRRFQDQEWVKGHTKKHGFDLVVVVDESGSMSDNEILYGLNEIEFVASKSKARITMLKVDTQVHEVEKFKRNASSYNRSSNGGTHIYPAIEYIYENRIPCNAIVVITDGGIENVNTWERPPTVPTFFLSTDVMFDISHLPYAQIFKLDSSAGSVR